MKRIVIDTNCLVAILPALSPYHQVWKDFLEGELEFCVTTEILLEYEEIISAKTSPYFAAVIIKALINSKNLIRVNPAWRFQLIKVDLDDNKFIDCAVCGQADYIVSEDKHFRSISNVQFPPINIIRLKDFCKKLKAGT